tara:strand:- start:420 stop:1265 length:846 start_codon:yes stop_codon:yes gene_type:complete
MKWEVLNSSFFVEKWFLFFTNLLEKIMLNQASTIVAVSNVLKNDLLKKGYKNVIVVNNGVDTTKFKLTESSQIRQSLKIPKDNLVFCFCGTFGFWHGIDAIEHAIVEISNKKVNCHFLLIGDGYYRKELQNKVGSFSNVTFTGEVDYDNIVEYLSVGDIFLSPHVLKNDKSFIGSPTKLFEYMAMGKIIIASDLDQIGEILNPSIKVEDIMKGRSFDANINYNAITFDPTELDNFVYAIEYCAKNYQNLNFIGENALQNILDNHTWDLKVNEIINELSFLR